MENLLSIIVPMYNVESEAPKLVRSLSMLNYHQYSISFTFVDDGCTDRTVQNVQDVIDSDPPFMQQCQLIHQKNAGMSAARNFGLRKSQGDYVWFIDSDDLINPEFVNSVLLPLLANHQFEFLQLEFSYFQQTVPEEKNFTGLVSKLSANQLFKKLALGQIESFPWAHIIDRNLIRNDHFFPEGKAYEDVATTYKLIGHAKRLAEVSGTAYYYRKRAGSITHSGYFKHVVDLYSIIEELRYDTSVEQNLFTPENWNLFISRMLMVTYVETLRSEKTATIRKFQHKLRNEIIAMHPRHSPYEYKVKLLLLRLNLLGLFFSIKDSLQKKGV